MKRGLYFASRTAFLGFLLLASCRSMVGESGAPLLLKLAAGAEPPAATARLTGVLTRDGACWRVAGNGVIIWPLAENARSRAIEGNVVVIWPGAATLQRTGINGVAIWPVAVGSGTPVHVGEPVELVGGMKDDVSGLRLDRPLPRGCTGRAFVASEFRPAPAEAR